MNKKLKLQELQRLSIEEYQASTKSRMVVILDDVRSMHNVGSVFRTCDAFRIEKLYLCGISPTPPHREIHKTALGAEDSVNWEARKDILDLISELKQNNYTIIAVEQTENSVLLPEYKPQNTDRVAVILGNEVEGVSQEAINAADFVLEIPQFGTKHSLNVSVATGIVLYDIWSKLMNNE